MELEATATELMALARKQKLLPDELDRAKYLMVALRRLGMSNAEIANLTGKRWSEPTVRGYTAHIRSADPAVWEGAATQLEEMLSKGLTLEDVKRALDINAELEAKASSLGDVVAFMQELKDKKTTLAQLSEATRLDSQLGRMGTSSTEVAGFLQELKEDNIDARAFVSLFHDWHRAGLTAGDVSSALNYKRQLEEAGLGIQALAQIGEAAAKFGSPAGVLEALAKYGSLGELDQRLETKQGELETLAGEIDGRHRELDAAANRLQGVRKEIADAEDMLATYRRLAGLGFNEGALAQLAEATQKYGRPRQVLAALNRFGKLSDIKAAHEQLRDRVEQERTKLKTLQAEHSHLREPIELVKRLLKRRFGLRALSLINATARRYGEPTEVLKAIEAYGKLTEVEQKISQANAELIQTQARIQKLKEVEAEYEARNAAILRQLEELNAKAIEVGRQVGAVEALIAKDGRVRDILSLLQDPISVGYEESLPLVLVLLNSISTWAKVNADHFRYPALINSGLQQAIGNLVGT